MNCRFCHAVLSDVFLDLGTAPPSNAFLSDEDLEAESWFPLKLHLQRVQAGAGGRGPGPRKLSHPTTWMLGLRGHGWSTQGATWTRWSRACSSGHIATWWSWRPTMATCCSTLPRAASRAWASSPPRAPRGGAREGHRDARCSSSARRSGARLARPRRAADLIVGQQRAGARARHQRLRRGHSRAALKPDGVATFEFPHLLGWSPTTSSTPFTTSTSPTCRLTAVAAHLRRQRPARLRRRGAAHPWRQPARLRGTSAGNGGQPAERPSPRCCAKREHAAGVGQWPTTGLPGRGREGKDDLLSLPDRAKRTGKPVAAYGAAAKGNTLLNFAGVRGRPRRATSWTQSPPSRARFMPGSRIPIVDRSAPAGARAGSSCSSCPGTCATRSQQLEYLPLGRPPRDCGAAARGATA